MAETRPSHWDFVARWVTGGWSALDQVGRIFNCKTVRDAWNRPVLLFKNEWNLNQLNEEHPDLKLSAVAPVVSVEPISFNRSTARANRFDQSPASKKAPLESGALD